MQMLDFEDFRKKQMDEVIKENKVRTGLVLGSGQSFLFNRIRAMAQPHSKT